MEKGSHYVKKSPPEKRAAISVAKMCQKVNDVCNMLIRQPLKGENAFSIIRDKKDVTSTQRHFKFGMTNAQGHTVTVPAEVSDDGEIKCEGFKEDTSFPTIMDAVLAIKQNLK